MGEDINGNGEVRVELRQFIIAEEDQTSVAIALEDTQRGYASSLLFGSVFLIDSGEFAYNERILENIRYLIDREFRVE